MRHLYVLLILVCTGCAGSTQYLTQIPAKDLAAIETREFPTDYETVFRSTVAGLQDAGYTIAVAEPVSGVITTSSKAKSILQPGIRFVVSVYGGAQSHTISAQVRRVDPTKSSVRLKIIQEAQDKTGAREELSDITPVEDYRRTVSALFDSISKNINSP